MEAEDPDTVIRDVGRRVAELRSALGLTQDKFAEALGVSGVYVRRVEIGRENLTLRSLTRFASMLGVRTADLLQAPLSREVRVGRPPRRAELAPGTGGHTPGTDGRSTPDYSGGQPGVVGESQQRSATEVPDPDHLRRPER